MLRFNYISGRKFIVFCVVLEFAFKKVQETKNGLELCWTHQL